MTQHLATINEILVTKCGFSGAKCTKIVFIFGRGSAPDPLGDLRRSPIPPCALERGIPLSPSTHSASRCPGPVFFKYDHLCLCLVSPSVPYSMSSKYQFVTNRGSRDDAGVPLAAAVASCISRCAALAAEFRNEVDLFTGD